MDIPRVSNACGAPITNDTEAELIQVLLQATARLENSGPHNTKDKEINNKTFNGVSASTSLPSTLLQLQSLEQD